MSKRILIASYVFPPFPGIGGRRWVKFAKELAKRDWEVDVIAAHNPFNHRSEWMADADHKNITVHRLEPRFPRYLMMRPKNVADKLGYHLSLMKVKRATKGNYYDRAVLWRDHFLRLARRLIKQHGLRNIIATGAPFHLVHQASVLKEENKELNFIADFRDPWTNNTQFMGWEQIGDSRREYEKLMELRTVQRADTVLTVADPMTEYFSALDPGTKVVTLPNGYDPDDMSMAATRPRRSSDKVRFILTGTLYDHLQTAFETFINGLTQIKDKHPEIFAILQFDFYGDAPDRYQEEVSAAGLENVHFNGTIPLNEVYPQIAASNVCMLFLQDHLSFSFSTKFYEYLYMGKKMIVFGKPGATADMVKENSLGYAADPNNVVEVLLQIIEDYKADRLGLETEMDITPYSVGSLTDKLVTYLVEE